MNNNNMKLIMYGNMKLCSFGALKDLPNYKSEKNYFIDTHDLITNEKRIAEISIVLTNPIILSKFYTDNGHNPIVLNLVSETFNENNDSKDIEICKGIYDKSICMKTNYYKKITNNLYPIKITEVIHTPNIFVIRDDEYNIISDFNNMFNISILTSTYLNKNNSINKKFNSDDYGLTKDGIENIFKTAIKYGYDVLILNDFDCKNNVLSIDDIVDIYNMMILKYHNFFASIVFAIHIENQNDRYIYSHFDKKILKLQHL